MQAQTIHISYPKDKSAVLSRILLTLIATLFGAYVITQNIEDGGIGLVALVFLVAAGIFDLSIRLHRILSYDSVVIDGNLLIVKKNGVTLNKTPLNNIDVYSKKNPFNFSGSSWKRLYNGNKLVFHYETNEIDEKDEVLLSKAL